jgi:flagellar basal-body rod modification protein FlgD
MTTVPSTTATGTNSIYDILQQQQQANTAASGSSSSTDTSSTDSSGSPTNALASLSGDYQNFLTLLTTQLQNQDPLSPMDTNQFTQQLVEFSGVEQQINGNNKLDQLIGLQSTANAYGAVGFVGTQVAASSDQLPVQNGSGRFDYDIEHNSSSALLKITNSSGQLVMVKQVDSTVGTHPVSWDGTDFNGDQLPDGAYTVAVSYQDSTGASYDAPITTYGTVDSAVISNGDVSLNMGAVSIPLDQVTNISKPTTPASTDTGTDSGTDPTTPTS